jgi:hypothetical protein
VCSSDLIAAGTDWSTDCATPLTPSGNGTWNNAVWNVTDNCASGCNDAACPSAADCLPAGELRFFEFSGTYEVNPGFIDAPNDDFCISSPVLVDTADDLGYDRNGEDDNNYNGYGPDIGAVETGSGTCPALYYPPE